MFIWFTLSVAVTSGGLTGLFWKIKHYKDDRRFECEMKELQIEQSNFESLMRDTDEMFNNYIKYLDETMANL